MIDNLTISIAMCTYNGEMHLQEQLDSFLNQTRLPNEIIVCDDGSKDATVSILEEFSRRAPFEVKIYRNDRNLGYVKNFEKAISLCSGHVIALSDQDDVWSPQKLSVIEKTFSQDESIAYAVSDAEMVGENLEPLGYSQWDRYSFTLRCQQDFSRGGGLRQLVSGLWFQGACLAFRADLRALCLPIPAHWAHDNWIPLVLTAIPHLKGSLITAPLVKYRQHRNQITRSWDRFSYPEKLRFLKENNYKMITSQILKWETLIDCMNSEVNHPELLAIVQHRLAHFKTRQALPQNRIMRFVIILKEIIVGGYLQYSQNPWKSPIIDLVL